jgi:hypothetical protein
MRNVPINPQTSVWIDLTDNTIVGDTRRGADVAGASRGATTTNIAPRVGEHGAVATSSTTAKEKSKGKGIVPIVEKGIQIMKSKMKKMKPDLKR